MDSESIADSIGFSSAFILLMTMGRQVFTQWRCGTFIGVSRWLFGGQILASCGFIAYSVMLGNKVFIVTNSAMLLVAVLGQYIHARNQKQRLHKATDSIMIKSPEDA